MQQSWARLGLLGRGKDHAGIALELRVNGPRVHTLLASAQPATSCDAAKAGVAGPIGNPQVDACFVAAYCAGQQA